MTAKNMPARALVIDLSTKFGGASMRALDLIRGMPDGQAALAGLEGSPSVRRAADLGLEVYAVGNRKFDPLIVYRLVRLARREGFNVFDTQNPQSKLWGTLAACIARVGLISTLNSWYFAEHQGRWRGWFYQGIEFFTLPLTDACIAVSSDIEKKLEKTAKKKIHTEMISNAVTIDAGTIKDSSRESLRTRFNFSTDSIMCCAVGRLVEAKGYHHLVNSFHLLDRRFVCLIVGDGHLKNELADQIQQLGMQERIRLVGFCEPEDVLSIVNASDIFVMPSISEGTPIAILEAAALGKPIVATKTGGIPEIFTDNEHAVLVEPGNEQQLADAVSWLCDHQGRAEMLGSQARIHIEKSYSLDSQVKETLAVYQKVLSVV
jgi:glycosyltransferase involved in cell wall biosynthesis